MKVQMLKYADAGGQACYPDQYYELPDDEAQRLIKQGVARAAKAKSGPPEDKAGDAPRSRRRS